MDSNISTKRATAKVLSEEALSAARAAAVVLSENIERFERMSPAELARNAVEIFEVDDALTQSWVFPQPAGMPHDQAVLDWREWRSTNAPELMREWGALIQAIPDDGYKRFCELVCNLVPAVIAAEVNSKQADAAASARWSRLDDVKAWAFEQRRNDPHVSRAAVIRRIAGDVRAKAKASGEPLTGDDRAVIDTVTRWFRKAKIA